MYVLKGTNITVYVSGVDASMIIVTNKNTFQYAEHFISYDQIDSLCGGSVQ